MATSKRQRERQRANRKYGKDDRVELKMADGKTKDPTAFFATKYMVINIREADRVSASGGGSLNKTEKYVGRVTATELNVRSWPGTENKTVSFSPLRKGEKVSVCDSMKASDGSKWLYICKGGKFGFCHSAYITKV